MSNVITMRRLGRLGRWGNQLFQWMFLNIYSQMHDAQWQCPDWLGTKVFDLPSQPVTIRLPEKCERCVGDDQFNEQIPPEGAEYIGFDFVGYAQYRTDWYAPFAEYWRAFYGGTPERLREVCRSIHKNGATVIGLHIRRGDYGKYIFPVIPVEWYRSWLEEHWDEFDNPVLFLSTEDRRCADVLSKWAPNTPETLGVNLSPTRYPLFVYDENDIKRPQPHTMDFLPDWFLLRECNVLVTPSSTFSFTAALSSRNLRRFFRASLRAEKFVEENPWSTTPLLHERVEDFIQEIRR